ncbi:hypothetical protein [Actinocrispum wychmicini]|uniref:hypothetical protein n=1 Tax=Actinocrispum wychmicini TaxID=1213861 RepID=UPI001FB74915|nr:hypothetical protein [Actinocrispum wychmicini]
MQVQADQFRAAQASAQQQLDHGSVPAWPGVPVRGWRLAAAVVAAALEAVESLQSVEHVLDRADLRLRQRAGRRRGQGEQLHPFGRIPMRQCLGRGMRDGPGEQRREVREVVVHRSWRHRLCSALGEHADGGGGQVVAPAGDLARGDRRDPVVPVAVGEPIPEPVQVPGDLRGDFRGADPSTAAAR